VQPERHPIRRFGPEGRFVLKEESGATQKYARITETTSDGVLSFELPQSTWDEFEKSRPTRVRDGYTRDGTTIEEEIGPNQVVGNRLWFGKSFYDAEGITGIGGFGYFDCEARRFVMYSPPEIRNSSVTSILVIGNDVWMSTAGGGEYGASPHALLRWDMSSEQIHSQSLDAVVTQMADHGDELYLATYDGIEVLTRHGFQRFMIEITRDGNYRVTHRQLRGR
jgi:hypothetical protein